MHKVKYNSITDGQPFVVTDKADAFSRGKPLPFETVVEHGKSVVIKFNHDGNKGSDPADEGEKRKQHQANHINRLPECVAQCKLDAPHCIFHKLGHAEGKVAAFHYGFGFFAQPGKYRRADNEKKIFEQRKIKHHLYQPENNAGESEKKTQPGVLNFLQPHVEPGSLGKVINGRGGSFAKEIHADGEKHGIKQAGDENPFPEPVPDDELMRFKIGLDGYDDFFEQSLNLGKYS